ncbi:MAG TPA: helicase [Lachnospiraceae bacterium]|nr:helicase [Lachnospiraceae bacterium]
MTRTDRAQRGKLIVEPERGEIRISVRNLVEFILRSGDIDNRKKGSADIEAMLEGARLHRLIQSRTGPEYHAEVPLRECFAQNGYDIIVEGRADGIIYREPSEADSQKALPVTIDEIKSTWLDVDKLKEPVYVHLAQARCYAYIWASQNKLPEISVRMTYVNSLNRQVRYFHETCVFSELEKWFGEILSSYKRWADFQFEWYRKRNRSAASVEFPFVYREGQKELVSQVYRTIYHRRKLFLEAPTGTGKTISVVFPSVKAVGAGLCDKIFYLTAKTITRTVAAESFELLRDRGLCFKTVVITAKEKICPLEETECNPVACPYARGHFDRINDAIFDLLTSRDSFMREEVEEFAKKHTVCPFELALDMSLFSDAVICDYNYVFDPNVYLRRFFSDSPQGKYVFLVDEAHNLADRAMKMYSAELLKEEVMAAKRLVKEHDSRLSRALEALNRKFLLIKRETEDIRLFEDISDFMMALNRACSRLEDFLEDNDGFEKRKELLEFYFKVRHFINMYDNMGSRDYVIYSELKPAGLMLKLLCTDPSESLKKRLLKGVSTVFFSATLLPIRYYKDMLGAEEEDYAVYASSVFDERKRGLFIACDVSSKYTRRGELEYRHIAEYINACVRQRKGNYMVFFPSHSFLMKVYEQYTGMYSDADTEVLCQKSNMTEEERESFLGRFLRDDGGDPECTAVASAHSFLVGFCVTGGIFSEGIDLKNDSLIGAVIVGTGLPMVCNERELMKKSYDRMGYDGFDYAYRFPGMNKVLQAAGRVIRTVDDVGIVALLDERFLTGSYRKLFPKEWRRFEVISLESKEDKINEFWELADINEGRSPEILINGGKEPLRLKGDQYG